MCGDQSKMKKKTTKELLNQNEIYSLQQNNFAINTCYASCFHHRQFSPLVLHPSYLAWSWTPGSRGTFGWDFWGAFLLSGTSCTGSAPRCSVDTWRGTTPRTPYLTSTERRSRTTSVMISRSMTSSWETRIINGWLQTYWMPCTYIY